MFILWNQYMFFFSSLLFIIYTDRNIEFRIWYWSKYKKPMISQERLIAGENTRNLSHILWKTKSTGEKKKAVAFSKNADATTSWPGSHVWTRSPPQIYYSNFFQIVTVQHFVFALGIFVKKGSEEPFPPKKWPGKTKNWFSGQKRRLICIIRIEKATTLSRGKL